MKHIVSFSGGKDVKEENTGCYVGIDRNNKQKLVGGVLSGRK